MPCIELKPLFHRGTENIGIYFPKDTAIENCVRKVKAAKWSRTHCCWYLPKTPAHYRGLLQALQGIEGLKMKVHKKEAVKAIAHQDQRPANPISKPAMNKANGITPKLSRENAAAFAKFIEELILKAYSPSTIKTYRNEFLQLLQLLKNKPVQDLTQDDLRRYFVYCFETAKLSENTLHSRINAVKFYFEKVLGGEHFFWEIPRPKKPQLLPKLLNENEIGRLFNALQNKKHKAMLFTAYSAGLRVSELVNLRISDIDSGRMQILVRLAKGKKDRYVCLSPVLLDILRTYLRMCSPKPDHFLFESGQTGTAYPTRTVQKIFSEARKAAGIHKQVGIHSLRHSFATHLLDKGTDIRYIKDLLGHFDIRTTERYLHVSNQSLVNIISPFDDLWKSGTVDW